MDWTQTSCNCWPKYLSSKASFAGYIQLDWQLYLRKPPGTLPQENESEGIIEVCFTYYGEFVQPDVSMLCRFSTLHCISIWTLYWSKDHKKKKERWKSLFFTRVLNMQVGLASKICIQLGAVAAMYYIVTDVLVSKKREGKYKLIGL